jgi:hypothetical protein
MTVSRRALLRAGAASAASIAAWRLQGALAQDEDPTPDTPPDVELPPCDNAEDFDKGGRVYVDDDEVTSYNEVYDNPPLLGRIEIGTNLYDEPGYPFGEKLGRANYGEVLPIYGVTHAPAPAALPHNDVWYETDRGYAHSSFVVPVTEQYNPVHAVYGDGFWGEITVPTSWQHRKPTLRSRRYYDLAWGAVFRVIDRVDEDCGRAWYRLLDDANPTHKWWVQAKHVRRIPESEFAPISPEVPPEAKRIEVLIGSQEVVCYEHDVPVFSTRIASGTTFFGQNGEVYDFFTPWGEHWVQRKTPSRHMSGGEDINDSFDLPGVPWCVFFTMSGAAIHGTYWHNDYGHPRSHGCVNVTPDAAKWIYRWVTPAVPYDTLYHFTDREERDRATLIDVTRG